MSAKYGPYILLSTVLIWVSLDPDVFPTIFGRSYQLFPLETRSIAQLTAMPRIDDDSPLQSFSLDQAGQHVFHFRQAHSGEMTLLLKVEGATGEPDRQKLTHFRTVIEVTLLNHAGRTVCQAAGSPGDGVRADSWVLRTSRGEAAFWHRNCTEIKLKRSELYKLIVRVRDVDPNMPKIKATPIFERSDAYGP